MTRFIHSDMMQKLLVPQAPWVYSAFTEKSDVEAFGVKLRENQSGKIVQMDAELLTTKKDLFEQFSHHYDFQEGFGKNWDAFYDCLKDAAWGVHEFSVIIILNSNRLLEQEDRRNLNIFKETLEDTAEFWAQKIHEGKAWDRPTKSLHALLHVLPVNKEKFLSKLDGRDLPELK